jgi:phage shock protein PspC (stress-responsive transcriptional regulator)
LQADRRAHAAYRKFKKLLFREGILILYGLVCGGPASFYKAHPAVITVTSVLVVCNTLVFHDFVFLIVDTNMAWGNDKQYVSRGSVFYFLTIASLHEAPRHVKSVRKPAMQILPVWCTCWPMVATLRSYDNDFYKLGTVVQISV